jgi:phosphomannomutase
VKLGTRTDAQGKTEKLVLPPSDVLIDELEGGSRIITRPSGTEPKLKIYVDVCEPMVEGEPLADAEGRAARRMEELKAAFSAIAGV